MFRIYKNIAYGPCAKQTFDIIIPKGKIAHAIVYIHGGAYLVGDKSEFPLFLADYSENNIVATINYRLINQTNNIGIRNILSDVHAALAKIIKLANTNSIIIKDFILIGHSAGGHIGLLYAYKYFMEKPGIAACISLAGPTDFTDASGWSSMTMWGETLEERLAFFSQLGSRLTGHTIELTQPNWTEQSNYPLLKKYLMAISPTAYLLKTKNAPPTLLVHARGDEQVPYSNAARLKDILDFYSIPNKLITPTGFGDNHMLGGESYMANYPIFFTNQAWVDEAKKWLEIYLGNL